MQKDGAEVTGGDENEMNLINQATSPKRMRMGSGDALSPEQKSRMEENKNRAKMIKLSKELRIIPPSIGSSWFSALEEEFRKPYFTKLNGFLETERSRGTVFPSSEEVWSWTTRTSIQDVRVVILGNPPYIF